MASSLRRSLAFLAALQLLAVPLPAVADAPASPGGDRAAQADRRPVPPLAGGIMINEPDHQRWVRSLRDAGLDTVQVTVYARQGRWDSADLTFDAEVPAVLSEIRAAKRSGLRVVLVLRTYLDQGLEANRHLWHGMIWPRRELLEDWFRRYRRFVLWGARLARREEVDLLAVGNELNSTTSTVVGDELPDPYAYYLDPSRTGPVRRRLVQCAETVPEERLAGDLRFLDGGADPDLATYLRAKEEARRRWSATVAGVGAAELRRIERLAGGPDDVGLDCAGARGQAAGTKEQPAGTEERPGDTEERSGGPKAAEPGRREIVDEAIRAAADLGALRRRMGRYERFWRRLIGEVRELYDGPITYGANFDQVDRVGFWDALDLIAVNAYFPLSRRGLEGEALRRQMVDSWREVARRLRRLGRSSHGGDPMPVVFLEMGWTRKAGSTVRPYSYTRVEVLETASEPERNAANGGGDRASDGSSPTLTCVHWATQPEDPTERNLALRSLLDVVRNGEFPELRGFLLWKLSTVQEHREIEPFMVLLAGPTEGERYDRRFLATAAELAAAIRRRSGELDASR